MQLQALLYSKRLSAQSRRVQQSRRFDPRASLKAMRATTCALFAALAIASALAAPAASSFAPVNGASNVHPLSSVDVTFDADVVAQAAQLIELRRLGTGQVLSTVAAVSSFVEVVGPKVSITFPLVHVPAGSVYVTIESGAFVSKADQTPFAGIAGSTWSFEYQGERHRALLVKPTAQPHGRITLHPREFGPFPWVGTPCQASVAWQRLLLPFSISSPVATPT